MVESAAAAGAGDRFGPFQAAANVMPFNIQTDPMHHMGNPFIRGFNPAFDGFTPQTGGHEWNNPNGPYWSPYHWTAPESYWSVYPPQYASHYVDGPTAWSMHPHHRGMSSSWDHGAQDPHFFGPHLDWPFGAYTADINHLPGMGAGTNDKLPFPQFLQVRAGAVADAELALDAEAEAADSAAAQRVLDAADEEEEDSSHDTDTVTSEAEEGRDFEVDSSNQVIPHTEGCVNCFFRD